MSDSVQVSAAHYYKPVKRRKVSQQRCPWDETQEPIDIYCSEFGQFYCYVGSEEVRADRMKDLTDFLLNRESELDTSLLLFEPKISLNTAVPERGLSYNRILYARHKTGGRLYLVELTGYRKTSKGPDYEAWCSKCEGPLWVEAYLEGIKKKWTRCRKVEDDRFYEHLIDYTEERWESLFTLKRAYDGLLREIRNRLMERGGDCLDAIANGQTPPLLEGLGKTK